MGKAVRQPDFDPCQLRRVARKRIAHLNGRRKVAGALLEHRSDIFARVLPSRKVQRDAPHPYHRNDPTGECAGAFVTRFAGQAQNAHARVVVVQYAALRRLPDQLLQRRADPLRGGHQEFPLRRGGQGHAQLLLQPFQPVKGHSRTVLHQGDHGHGRGIVLVRARRRRCVSGENLPAGIAAQPLHLAHGGLQRRVPYKSDQRGWLFLAIHFSAAAFRAKVAGIERGVRYGNPVGASKRSGTMAPMTAGSRRAVLRLARGRCVTRQNGASLLRTAFRHQSFCHGMQRGFELLAFRCAQRRTRAAIDNLIQLIQIHVDPPFRPHNWVRYSRKRGVRG